jgi:hypothetical protein
LDAAMKNHLQEVHLSAYERRLEALGAMLDREIHTILLHLAHEMPMTQATTARSVVQKVISKVSAVTDQFSGRRRVNARDLLEFYSYRLRQRAQATGIETPTDMLTYAQILDQALHDVQTLH